MKWSDVQFSQCLDMLHIPHATADTDESVIEGDNLYFRAYVAEQIIMVNGVEKTDVSHCLSLVRLYHLDMKKYLILFWLAVMPREDHVSIAYHLTSAPYGYQYQSIKNNLNGIAKCCSAKTIYYDDCFLGPSGSYPRFNRQKSSFRSLTSSFTYLRYHNEWCGTCS